jgi:hypothetical protein
MRFCRAILFCLLTAISPLIAQPKGSRIEFQTTSRDRGTVIQGETIKEVFAFNNKGSGTLEISSVEHS